MPAGDFSSTSSAREGFAKLGFSVGAEFYAEIYENWEAGLGGAFSVNGLDAAELQRQAQSSNPGSKVDAGSWQLLWVMGGVGFKFPVSKTIGVYGRGNGGLLFGRLPDITVTGGSATTHTSSTSATTSALGLSLGVLIDRSYDLGFSYFSAEPEYHVFVTSENNSLNASLKQPTTNILLTLGYNL